MAKCTLNGIGGERVNSFMSTCGLNGDITSSGRQREGGELGVIELDS